jgi:hypothetical protein
LVDSVFSTIETNRRLQDDVDGGDVIQARDGASDELTR